MDQGMLRITPSTIGYRGKPVLDFAGMELADGAQCLRRGCRELCRRREAVAVHGLQSFDDLAGHQARDLLAGNGAGQRLERRSVRALAQLIWRRY